MRFEIGGLHHQPLCPLLLALSLQAVYGSLNLLTSSLPSSKARSRRVPASPPETGELD